jgi:hypothetical protein
MEIFGSSLSAIASLSVLGLGGSGNGDLMGLKKVVDDLLEERVVKGGAQAVIVLLARSGFGRRHLKI